MIMNLTDLINEIKAKGFIGIGGLKLKGKALPTLKWLGIMAQSETYETDADWWELRLWIKRN